MSGSDQEELRHVFKVRDLDVLFDQIYGSPATKQELVEQICAEVGVSAERAVVFGDSRLDWEVARSHGLEFIMVHGFSEWADWEQQIPLGVQRTRDFIGLGLQ